jgi:predicted nucleic acid-binding Zn ribbon protein
MAGPTTKIKCDNCGKAKMSKIISSPYIRFDGPGWQTNDNRGIAKPSGGSDIDSSNFAE